MNLLVFESSGDCLQSLEKSKFSKDDLYLYWHQDQEQTFKPGNLEIFHINHFTRLYAKKIRQRAIYLLDELGESQIGSKSLNEFFLYKEHFSLWSASIIAEKNLLFGSASFADAIKLVTIEIILLECKISSVWTSIQDPSLVHSLHELCVSKKIDMKSIASQPNTRKSLNYSALDLAIASSKAIKCLITELALLALCRLASIHSNQAVARSPDSKYISIYSYLPSLHGLTDSSLRKTSDYLGNLPQMLLDEGYILEIHYINTLTLGLNNLRLLWAAQYSLANQSRTNACTHNILHNSLNSLGVISLIRIYLSFARQLTRIFQKSRSLEISTRNYLGLIFKKEILSSLIGPRLVKSLLYWHMFEQSIEASLVSNNLLLYLHEGSSWEKILLRIWKDQSRGRKSIGFIHSSARFWDLRLFDALGTGGNTNSIRNTSPDILAITADKFRHVLLDAGCLCEIRVVESLRHQYLFQLKQHINNTDSQLHDSIQSKPILVIGDYSQARTLQLLLAVEKACLKLSGKYHILFKPHPKSPEIPDLLSQIPRISLTTQNLLDSSYNVSLAICTDSTSATIDLQILNKDLIIYIMPESLGFPPIVSQERTAIAHSPYELADYIDRCLTAKRHSSKSLISCSTSCKLWLKLLCSAVTDS